MRIGIIFGQLSNGGGAYQLIHLARTLVSRGHQVEIITYYQPETEFAKEWLTGLSIHSCVKTYQPRITRDWQPIGLIRFLTELLLMTFRLAKLIDRFSFDVIQPHEWPFQWAAAWSRLKGGKQRIVWMCNDVWHIPGYEESKEKRILFKLTQKWLIVPLDRALTKRVDVITVLDHRIKQITGQFYSHAQIEVVRSGIDLEPYKKTVSRFLARRKLELPQNRWMWLCLSIFHPHRCFEDVIQALSVLRDQDIRPRLYIVGSAVHAPEYVEKLNKLIFDLSLQDQVFLINRYISQEEKQLYFAAANGFIFPNDQQTWGLVVIEAMASGLPCIVSSGAGVHEIIDHQKTGLVFERRNIEDLTQQMKQVMVNKSIRERLAVEGKHHVFGEYSWAAYTQQMEKFFRG